MRSSLAVSGVCNASHRVASRRRRATRTNRTVAQQAATRKQVVPFGCHVAVGKLRPVFGWAAANEHTHTSKSKAACVSMFRWPEALRRSASWRRQLELAAPRETTTFVSVCRNYAVCRLAAQTAAAAELHKSGAQQKAGPLRACRARDSAARRRVSSSSV